MNFAVCQARTRRRPRRYVKYELRAKIVCNTVADTGENPFGYGAVPRHSTNMLSSVMMWPRAIRLSTDSRVSNPYETGA